MRIRRADIRGLAATTWGGISIERAYAEYDVDEHLTIRAGRFLTPYGIWNADHGSPVVIAPFRPYVIGDAYFPEHQTGYHATITDGRSPVDAVSDLAGRSEARAIQCRTADGIARRLRSCGPRDSPDEVGRYWIARRVRGQSGAPRTLPSVALVQKVVAKFPNAISYLPANELTADVQPVKVDGFAYTDRGYSLLAE